jgi:transaldolase
MNKESIVIPKIFADTSREKDIEEMVSTGTVYGITTNPLIVAKESSDRNPLAYYSALAKKFKDLPISVQLLDDSFDNLYAQAKSLANIAPNIVIKVPMFSDGKGLALIAKLTRDNIPVNVTALMNSNQLLLALIAGRGEFNKGPAFVSLFYNRIKDSNGDPRKEISLSRNFINKTNSSSEIIVGSIRQGKDVFEASRWGAHIITVAPKVFWSMIAHEKTQEFINQCQSDWDSFLSGKS